MDKKILNGIVDDMVQDVVATGVSDVVARAFVGFALQANRKAILAGIAAGSGLMAVAVTDRTAAKEEATATA